MLKTISYRQVGDYFIPNLKLSAEEKATQIGVWGMRRKNYLLNNNRILFNIMLADGTLWKHLTKTDIETEELFSRLIDEMTQVEGITEQLKATDQLAWVGTMNNIKQIAIEIINQEMICC